MTQLPPSKLDRDDMNKYPLGPNGMAQFCEDRIAELEAAKAAWRTGEERRPINQHLHTMFSHLFDRSRTRRAWSPFFRS